ncbi:MAG: hypothetical protein II388_02620 [Clostridia bacterium]|nr:hypothetical protein [Clostridia bacterium]
MDEKLIKKYMQKLDLTREEAIQLINDDNSKSETPEQAELSKKAKENLPRHYETSTTPRKKAVKPRKVDETKKDLLADFEDSLPFGCDCLFQDTETELHFRYEGAYYTLKLTRHSKKVAEKVFGEYYKG